MPSNVLEQQFAAGSAECKECWQWIAASCYSVPGRKHPLIASAHKRTSACPDHMRTALRSKQKTARPAHSNSVAGPAASGGPHLLLQQLAVHSMDSAVHQLETRCTQPAWGSIHHQQSKSLTVHITNRMRAAPQLQRPQALQHSVLVQTGQQVVHGRTARQLHQLHQPEAQWIAQAAPGSLCQQGGWRKRIWGMQAGTMCLPSTTAKLCSRDFTLPTSCRPGIARR